MEFNTIEVTPEKPPIQLLSSEKEGFIDISTYSAITGEGEKVSFHESDLEHLILSLQSLLKILKEGGKK